MYNPKHERLLNMEKMNLKNLYENHMLEVKEAKGGLPKSIWETYSAFANTSGGILILGAKENGDLSLSPSGLSKEDIEKLKKDFWNNINNKSIVSKNIISNENVQEKEIDGSFILQINVPKAQREDKPIYVFGNMDSGSYKRNAEGDYHCTSVEIKTMVAESISSSSDSSILEDADISWLSSSSIDGYKNMFKAQNPTSPWSALGKEDFLLRIGALKDKNRKFYPTIAGLLFFGYDWRIRMIFPNYFLDYADERDFSLNKRYLKRISTYSGDWDGNLYEFLINVATDISLKMPKEFNVKNDTIFREDDSLLIKAIREGLANACSNSDFNFSQGLKVVLKENGLRIENPGLMLIDEEQALKGGQSEPRNPSILNMLSSIGIGDRQGWGISFINEALKQNKFGELSIKETTCPDRTTLFLPINFKGEKVETKIEEKKIYVSFKEYLDSVPANTVFTRKEAAEALNKSIPSVAIYLRKAIESGKIKIADGYKIGKYIKQ